MSAQPKHSSVKKNYKREFFLVTVFFFVLFGAVSFLLLNLSFLTPFKNAFKDFSLSDFYYSKLQSRNRIYNGPLVLVNGENRSSEEVAFLIQRLQEGTPKVIGVDMVSAGSEGTDLLKDLLTGDHVIFSNSSATHALDSVAQSSNSTAPDVFMSSLDQRDFTTIRSYAPFYNSSPAFTTSIIQKFDTSLAAPLINGKKKELDIRFWGHVQNFRHFSFDQVMDPAFDLGIIKNKIVLVGYFGLGETVSPNSNEGLFYTPLNEQLAGRSHPDMYGSLIQANILRMALDRDYIKTIPAWLNWTIAFLLCWLLVPFFVKWYVFKPMWSHLFTKSTQLAIIILFMYLTVMAYAASNLKIEPAVVLASVVLLGDAILFYDGLVKLLKQKLKLRIHSIYFEH